MAIQPRKKSEGLGKIRICSPMDTRANTQAVVGILRTDGILAKAGLIESPASGLRLRLHSRSTPRISQRWQILFAPSNGRGLQSPDGRNYAGPGPGPGMDVLHWHGRLGPRGRHQFF